MTQNISRRRFLQSSAAVGAALAGGAALASATGEAPLIPWKGAAKDQLNIAIIGNGWRGMDHVREFPAISRANVFAVCDTDTRMIADATKVLGNVETYTNFHELLKNPRLDAVVIATPDHSHATLASTFLRAGKHVYCEKPLAHTVYEARKLADLAKQSKLVTQMGIQIHGLDNYRRVVELVQSNAIGPVHEVHIWNNRGLPKPMSKIVPPPKELNYDLWLGPVSERPFREGYHPKWWRSWNAFGSGLLGDIFCHLADVAFWALDLKHPTRIQTEGPTPDPDLCPEWTIAHFNFPARGSMPEVKLTWYDPPKKPPQLPTWNLDTQLQSEAIVFVGENGILATNYTQHQLLPVDKFKNFKPPPKRIPSSRGFQHEWVDACLAKDPKMATAPFAYGSLLTEAALLGLVAYKAGQPLEWDANNLRFPNAPQAEKLLKINYRPGWNL